MPRCIFLLLILVGCTDFRGASTNYAYTPKRANLVWAPKDHVTRVKCPPLSLEDVTDEFPLTLGEVVDIALARNPDTMESWAIAREKSAEYGKSLKNDFVQAELGSFYDRSRSAQFTSDDREIIYETLYGADVKLHYLVFDFGQTRWSSKAALQALYEADWTHNRTLQTIMQRVMNDYYNYLDQKEQLLAREADVANAQVVLDSVKAKLTNGVADMGELVQAKTQLLEQQLSEVTQKKRLHDSYTKLVSEMGIPADKVLVFEDYPQIVEVMEVEDLEALIASAIENRPDLLAKEADYKSQRAAITAAIAHKLPKITGDFDIGRTYYGRGLNDEYDFKLEFKFSLPLFQGFFIKNNIALARARLEQARAELEQMKLTILEQVSNSQSDVLLARESITIAKEFLESAQEEFRINLEKYKVGTGTIVELIDAQTSVADAQAKLAQTKKEWYTSLANLASATGILYPES